MLALGFAEMLLGPRVGDTVGTGAVRSGGAGIGAGDGGDGGGAGGNQEWGWGPLGQADNGVVVPPGTPGHGHTWGTRTGGIGADRGWGTLSLGTVGQAVLGDTGRAGSAVLCPDPPTTRRGAGRERGGRRAVGANGWVPSGEPSPLRCQSRVPLGPLPCLCHPLPRWCHRFPGREGAGKFCIPGVPPAAREQAGLAARGRMGGGGAQHHGQNESHPACMPWHGDTAW